MALVNWKDDYAVGHVPIDQDHRKLFQLINDFHHAYTASRDRREVALMLTTLIRYAEEHFTREEAIMAEAGYPELAVQQDQHVKLVEAIFALQGELESQSMRLDKDLVKFLSHWLLDHIVDHDRKLGAFLAKERGAPD